VQPTAHQHVLSLDAFVLSTDTPCNRRAARCPIDPANVTQSQMQLVFFYPTDQFRVLKFHRACVDIKCRKLIWGIKKIHLGALQSVCKFEAFILGQLISIKTVRTSVVLGACPMAKTSKQLL